MKHGTRHKRERQSRTDELLRQIGILESKHKGMADEQVKAELVRLREQLKSNYWTKAKGSLIRTQSYYYEFSGINNNRGLPRSQRKHQAKTFIPQIIMKDCQRKNKPKDIVDAFREYYEGLYNLKEELSGQSALPIEVNGDR